MQNISSRSTRYFSTPGMRQRSCSWKVVVFVVVLGDTKALKQGSDLQNGVLVAQVSPIWKPLAHIGPRRQGRLGLHCHKLNKTTGCKKKTTRVLKLGVH